VNTVVKLLNLLNNNSHEHANKTKDILLLLNAPKCACRPGSAQ